ncbi:MAG: DUF542 domain-containing protein [Ignavibacteriales bacterium]|nr:DUF542 domain-containing protein [Ignavibacteriales bacterium]
MNNYENKSIRDIVLSHPQLIGLFEKKRIDFCCNGHVTLSAVLNEKRYTENQKEKFLAKIEEEIASEIINTPVLLPEFTKLKELCQYIIQTHHAYVVKETIEIPILFEKVVKAHAANHPEVTEAGRLTIDLLKDLKSHLHKEETILFPLIKYLEDCKHFEEKPHLGRNQSIRKIINVMESDHQTAGIVTEKIRELLNDYKAPADACMTYELLLQKLDSFEKDLHIHVHLENNILYPKAIELEDFLHTTYKR